MTKSDFVSEANASIVEHFMIELDGVDIFYREVGSPNNPVILLPHGYPSSSFQSNFAILCRNLPTGGT